MSGFDDDSMALLADSRSRYDPTVCDGFTPLFNAEVKITFITPDSVPEQRVVRARIFKREDSGIVQAIRLELTRETELKFYLVSSFDAAGFETLKKNHNLRPAFSDFPQSIKDLLTRSVTASKECQLEFRTNDGLNGDLAFIQILRLRKIDVFVLSFQPAPVEFVHRHAQYRFNSLKIEFQQVSQDYTTLTSRLEERNPHLAKQVRKSVETTVLRSPH
jgi:hypothetical protein